MGWILGFCAMASLGLPGLAGFWGEFPAVLSAFEPSKLANGLVGGTDATLWTYRTFMVIAAIGTVLAAGYLLWMYQRVAMGTPKPEFEDAHIHDVHGPGVDRVDAAAARHRRLRHLPQPHLLDHQRRRRCISPRPSGANR